MAGDVTGAAAPSFTAESQLSDIWRIVAWCLVGAAFAVAGAAVLTYNVSFFNTRVHLEAIASSGFGIYTAGLLLGAVVVSRVNSFRSTTLQALTTVLSVVIIAGVIYSIVDLLTFSIVSQGPDDLPIYSGLGAGRWFERMIMILPRVAVGLVALTTIVVANVRGRAKDTDHG
jgi:hypothetical protein